MTSAQPERLAMVVRNAGARSALPLERLEAAARDATPGGWRVEVRDPASGAEMRRAGVEAFSAGASAVLACGGDGTLNALLDGLAEVGLANSIEVGMMPAGTANVWAREAGIPEQPEAALALLASGRRVRADLGVARIGSCAPRRFLLMCGAGLDARVVDAVEQHPGYKRRLGRIAFGWPAFGTIATSPPVDTTVEAGPAGEVQSERLMLYQALAGNSRLYASLVRLTSGALMDDGMLDLVTLEATGDVPGRLRAASRAARALASRLDRSPPEGIAYRRSECFTLRPGGELPVQVDGDFAGVATPEEPLTLTVEPRAARLIVTDRARRLFLGW